MTKQSFVQRDPGSVLLLTVMIIAVLTTTTLGAVALRFEQLAATDKVNNSSVAKLAADSGLAKLKEKLTAGSPIVPTIYDLDKDQETTNNVDLTKFKPSPRGIVSSFEKAATSLPRCLAVAVVSPWTNGGKYLLQEDDQSNPAMIFHYANIVNDTPLGAIPENDSITNDADKQLPVSELTRMGHFYNPYAPASEQQQTRSYWTVRMGGPDDELLTRKNADGSGSYYEGLDFLYIPYLPRWTDTALTTSGGSQTGVDRITGDDLRNKFESLVKANNFKIWLDSSMKESVMQEYGLGDLFTDSGEENYRVTWLQPSLWNDLPEAEIASAYKTENINNTPTDPWTKQAQPLLTTGNGTNGWDADIVRGSRHFSFAKMTNNSNGFQFDPGVTLTALLYGSHEGIRLNQKITLTLLSRADRTPLALERRTTDQGKLYEAKITEVTVAGNTTTVKIKLSSEEYHTPKKADGRPIKWADLDSIVLTGNQAQFSTKLSVGSLTIADPSNDGLDVSLNAVSTCDPLTITACPAVGDIVNINKAGTTPFWGQVKSVAFAGNRINGFTIDKARVYPKPLRNQAVTTYTNTAGDPMIAYYGGEVVANDYDGGFDSENDELWLYNPTTNVWTYPTQVGTAPGRRSGSSLVFDEQNRRLVVFGGYYHEPVAITEPPGQINCEQSQPFCLSSNQPGLRIAKRVTNDVFAYTITTDTTGSWEQIIYPMDGTKKIEKNSIYQMRVVSTLAERSGLERWRLQARADNNQGAPPIIVNVNGSDASTIKLSPSAAGIAKGDELYIFSRSPYFNAWARVTAVDYPNDTITIVAHGNARGGELSITLTELFLQVITRQTAAQTCTGDINVRLYSCTISGDTTGYAVGDQVVLENYKNGKIEQILSGYISYFKPDGTFYFVRDERLVTIKDFRINGDAAKVDDESAYALPVGRYGGALQEKPGDPQGNKQVNYLWQGYSKNIATNTRFNEIWPMEFNRGVVAGPASVDWNGKPKAMDNPGPSTANDYTFKVVKPNYQAQVYTPPNGIKAPEVIKDKTVTDEQSGQQTIEWDNGKTWELTIDTAGNEALAPGRLVANAPIAIERENGPNGPNPNARETFNGTIVSTFANGYDSTVIKIKHNPSYASDSGLKVHSKNAKISIFSTYRTDYTIPGGNNKIRWVDSDGGYLKLHGLDATEIPRVPSIGLAVSFWREVNGHMETYTMTVKKRTYDAGVDEFRLYPDDRPYASPVPIAYGSNAVVSHNGNDAFTLALTDYQSSFYGQGASEWFANAKDNNPLWQVRISDTNSTELNDRPSPRLGGAFGATYNKGSFKSQIFEVGGTFGRFADLWRMDDAGKKMTDNGLALWKIGKASPDSSKDLPNLFGGSLVPYEKDGAIKAIYFGGKLKFDNSSNDYGKYIGPRLLGEPDIATFSKPDNSYYLPDNADVDSVGFVNTTYNNFNLNGNLSSDVQATRDSLKLSSAGLSSYNKKVCSYVGQDCNDGNDNPLLMQHLGALGRIGSDQTSIDTYGGYSWGASRAILNPGAAFRKQGVGLNEKARLIMSASASSGSTTNGRWDQDGYQPYLCDTLGLGCAVAPYGTTTTSYTSNKTMMLAGFATITGANEGGAILVTTMGIGTGLVTARGGNDATGRWYSYCADYYYHVQGKTDFRCKAGATRYLKWLPDPEDLVFLFNSSLVLASTDTYKVVGYHGGAKRGYQVIKRPGRDPVVFEIVP